MVLKQWPLLHTHLADKDRSVIICSPEKVCQFQNVGYI